MRGQSGFTKLKICCLILWVARQSSSYNSDLTPKTAFLFPGQGSQFAGMGKNLADRYSVARSVFEEADDALGFSLSSLCFEGPEER